MEKLDVLHIAYPLCQGLQFHSVAGKKVLGMASTNEEGGRERTQELTRDC